VGRWDLLPICLWWCVGRARVHPSFSRWRAARPLWKHANNLGCPHTSKTMAQGWRQGHRGPGCANSPIRAKSVLLFVSLLLLMPFARPSGQAVHPVLVKGDSVVWPCHLKSWAPAAETPKWGAGLWVAPAVSCHDVLPFRRAGQQDALPGAPCFSAGLSPCTNTPFRVGPSCGPWVWVGRSVVTRMGLTRTITRLTRKVVPIMVRADRCADHGHA